jgi:hypothetical protein
VQSHRGVRVSPRQRHARCVEALRHTGTRHAKSEGMGMYLHHTEAAFFLYIRVLGLLTTLMLAPLSTVFALSSGDEYLRLLSGDALSTTSPTATTAQFKDSPAVNRTTYQEIGVWTAAAATGASLRLSETTALHVWLGLKNSDDQGTYFDLRAEVRKNGVVIASGETKNIQGVTRNANQAKEVQVTFSTPVNAQFNPGDVLSVRILAKVADSGGHNTATSIRLYYDALSRKARFGATFTPSNTPPIANAGSGQTGVVGQTIQLDGSGSSDSDGDPLTYQWTLTGKPSGSNATLANPTTVQPTFVIDKPGNYTVQLIVNDGTVNSVAATVVISTVNSAPVAHAGSDQSGVVGQTLQLDGGSSSDVDGDALTYQWTLTTKPAGSNAGVTNPTSVTPTVTLDKAGSYAGQLVVNDGTVNSAPDTVLLSTTNSAPVANAGPDQSATVGQTVQLDGSGSSDVDGDLLTSQWAFTAVPSGSHAALSDPSAVQPTFVVDKPGTYVVQLLVNDGAVNSAADTVTISTVNSRPVADAGPDQSVQVGVQVTFNGSESFDVDGDTLTYQWAFTARPATSTATLDDPQAVTPHFIPDKPGTYTVQLLVQDGAVESAPDTVTVSTINTKPIANAGPDQDGQVGVTVSLDGSGSTDADGDALTYQWSLASVPDGSTATLTGATAAHAAFLPNVGGTYVVQLIVNDGTVDSDPDTATVTVTVDTTPPPPAESSRLTVSPVTNGHVTVTGSPGSVESGARVTVKNLRTNQTVLVTAAVDGSFILPIDAQLADRLLILVTDSSGNTSLGRMVGIEQTPGVMITEPAIGAVVSTAKVRVRGQVQGPANTGVAVNGITALVLDGEFIVDAVPLEIGLNALTAVVTTRSGNTASYSRTITRQGTPPTLELEASPQSGIGPLNVALQVTPQHGRRREGFP